MTTDTLPDLETLDSFAEHIGLTLEARAISGRPELGRDSDWDAKADHFAVTLFRDVDGKPVPLWSGNYSTGAAFPAMWARDGAKLPPHVREPMKARNRAGLAPASDTAARTAYARLDNPGRTFGGRVSIHDSKLLDEIRGRYQVCAPLDPLDVLGSLQSDVMDSDSPFEDWAESLGYDTDSRKAESIWRACQDTARALRAGLGLELFARFLECEPR